MLLFLLIVESVFGIIILNSDYGEKWMDIKEFAKKHSFTEMSPNIYYRVHNEICVDVLEVSYKEEYFTVNLSVNCLINKELGFSCIASNNLATLRNPLFNEYWWKSKEDLEKVIECLEIDGENFWKQYSTLEKIILYMDFGRKHSPWEEFDEDDEELFELLNSLKDGQEEVSFSEITQEILQWMSEDESGIFDERSLDWMSFYGMNYYSEYGEEDV